MPCRSSGYKDAKSEPQRDGGPLAVDEVGYRGRRERAFFRLILTSSSPLHDTSSVFCYAKSTFSRWRRHINAKLFGVYPNVLLSLPPRASTLHLRILCCRGLLPPLKRSPSLPEGGNRKPTSATLTMLKSKTKNIFE